MIAREVLSIRWVHRRRFGHGFPVVSLPGSNSIDESVVSVASSGRPTSMPMEVTDGGRVCCACYVNKHQVTADDIVCLCVLFCTFVNRAVLDVEIYIDCLQLSFVSVA